MGMFTIGEIHEHKSMEKVFRNSTKSSSRLSRVMSKYLDTVAKFTKEGM